MVKTTFNSSSHRRDVLVQIVERYLHKRRDDSRQEDSENLKDIKAIQELMWQELGRRVEGFPKSPFKRTFRRLTTAQVQFHLVCKGRLISCAVFHWKDCNDFIHLKRTDGLNWLLGGTYGKIFCEQLSCVDWRQQGTCMGHVTFLGDSGAISESQIFPCMAHPAFLLATFGYSHAFYLHVIKQL